MLVFKKFPPGLLPFHFHFTGQRTYFYIVSRHPIDTGNKINNILDPYDKTLWQAISSSWASLIITVLVFTKVCIKFQSASNDFLFSFS